MKRIVLFIAALALPLAVCAQGYPSKPIKLVVGFAPGGAADTVARAYSEPLSRALRAAAWRKCAPLSRRSARAGNGDPPPSSMRGRLARCVHLPAASNERGVLCGRYQ